MAAEAIPPEHPRDLPAADAEAECAACAAYPADDPGRYARGYAAAATATALAARLAALKKPSAIKEDTCQWLVERKEICGATRKKQREAHFKMLDAEQESVAKANGTSSENLRVVAGIEEAFGPGAAASMVGRNNVFFSYEGEDGDATNGAGGGGAADKPKRPGSARRKSSSRPASGRKGQKTADPTKNLGDVRQMVAEEITQEEAFPKARGIVDGTGRRR